MTKKQHYMTEHERYKLESYLEAGRGVSWIARKLGFCRQTIYNEMKRGAYLHTVRWWDEIHYSADKGQQVHKYNQTAKGRPLKIGTDRAYADFLERKMLGMQENGKVDRRKRYSPAAALELARREGFETSICVGTLYNYIDKRVFLNLSNKDLWEKGRVKQKKQKIRRSPHPLLPSIMDRPEIINQRTELGHKEIDLIVGCEGSKAAILTITDRAGRSELAFKIQIQFNYSLRPGPERSGGHLARGRETRDEKSYITDSGIFAAAPPASGPGACRHDKKRRKSEQP